MSNTRHVHVAGRGRMVIIAAALWLLWPCASMATADANSPETGTRCTVEVVTGGIACIRDAERVPETEKARIWERLHLSLWGPDWNNETLQDVRERTAAKHRARLAKSADHIFYAVGRDVMEVRRLDGSVLRRARFPARIMDLSWGDSGKLNIVLDAPDASLTQAARERATVEMPDTITLHRPPDQLTTPPQQWWGSTEARFAARRDARRLANLRLSDADDSAEGLTSHTAKPAISSLQRARAADPTNPFYALELADLYGRLDRSDRVDELQQAAARRATPVWEDALWVWSILERRDAPDAAADAYERAIKLRRTAGIAPERTHALIAFHLETMISRGIEHPVLDPLYDQKFQRVHELSTRIAQAYPHLEGAARPWSELADWFANHNRPTLAATWEKRARDNERATRGGLATSMHRLDVLILAGATLLLLALIIPFVAGLRGGPARHRTAGQTDDGSDAPSTPWLPDPRWGDLAAWAVAILGLTGVLFAINAELNVIHKLSTAPTFTATDSLASPEVEVWLDSLHDSSQRDRLLSTARAEQKALIEGETPPEKSSTTQTLFAAIRHHAWSDQWRLFARGRLPNPLLVLKPGLAERLTSGDATTLSTGVGWYLYAILPAVGFVLFVVGSLVARATRGGTRWLLRCIPGAAARAGTPALLVTTLATAGALGLLGLGTYLTHRAIPTFYDSFGLKALRPDTTGPEVWWAWAALGAALVAHLWLVIADRRDT